MRILKAKDIFPKTYSIVNGEIVKNGNGEYYNKQVAEHILKSQTSMNDGEIKKLKKFDEEQLDNNAIKYFRNKYSMLLSSESDNINLLFQPNKRFEIFTLDTLGGKSFLVEASSLPDGEGRDLYYSFEIANQIYQRMIDIQDSTFNDYEEVKYIYERDILQTESEISDLKIRDNETFEKDINAYNLISQTPLYENYQLLNKDKEHLVAENENLNKTISDYNEKIRDLSQKLKVSLERVEFLQRPKTFFEKLKDLFKNDKKQLLIADGKGEE